MDAPWSRALALALVAALAVALSGCNGTPAPSPVASIPKIIIDFVDNSTTITITSQSADVRYENITVTLANANLSAPVVFHEGNSYALVGRSNLTFFTINATADEGTAHYLFDAIMHITERPPADPSAPPAHQIYIRETANGPIQQESIPYHQILVEG